MQGSRFHVCKDGWADDAGRPDVDAEDQVLDEPIEVSYSFTVEPLGCCLNHFPAHLQTYTYSSRHFVNLTHI